MANAYKALSALLTYPSAELKSATGEIRTLLGERGKPVAPLIRELESEDLIELQERYVHLFDRTRSLSLHLFEHVHGESRDRGQAMVDLAQHYLDHGLVVAERELPDYLPLFLEFLSVLPEAEARAHLAETAHILAAIGERLSKRGSAYASLFSLLVRLAETRPDPAMTADILKAPDDDPSDLKALDRAWEDAAVTFGPTAPDAGNCPQASEILARMDPPPPRRGLGEL